MTRTPNYWISLFSRKTYKEWRDAGCPPEACFPEGARGRVAAIAVGDLLLCYLSSPVSAFVGVQEVVGTMRDGGSTIWGAQYPLTLQVKNPALLEPEEAVRYLTLPSPCRPWRGGKQAAPCRAAGASANRPTPSRTGKASRSRRPS